MIFIYLYFFPSNVTRIERLINEGKYESAKALIEKNIKEDKNDKDIIKLYSAVNYKIAKDSCKIFESKAQFAEAISVIQKYLTKITDINYRDSIDEYLFEFTMKGVDYYKNKNDFLSAYNCIVPLLKINYPFNDKDINLIDDITKKMLTGSWQGYCDKLDNYLRLNMTAVSSKTFFGEFYLFNRDPGGTIYYHERKFRISNCSYDNMSLAASYKIPSYVKTYDYYIYDIKYFDFILNGVYDSGKIKVWLTIPTSSREKQYEIVPNHAYATKFVVDTLLLEKIK